LRKEGSYIGGSGGPNPRGKQIPAAKVTDKSANTVTFEMEVDDATYFEVDTTYKLIAIEKE
jgi:hypothetical protein